MLSVLGLKAVFIGAVRRRDHRIIHDQHSHIRHRLDTMQRLHTIQSHTRGKTLQRSCDFSRYLSSNCQELWMRILGSGCDILLLDGGFGDGGPFLELAVDEDCTGSHGWDEVGCVDLAPAVLRGVKKLVGHRQGRGA